MMTRNLTGVILVLLMMPLVVAQDLEQLRRDYASASQGSDFDVRIKAGYRLIQYLQRHPEYSLPVSSVVLDLFREGYRHPEDSIREKVYRTVFQHYSSEKNPDSACLLLAPLMETEQDLFLQYKLATFLSEILYYNGKAPEAKSWLEKRMGLARALQHPQEIVLSLNSLGTLYSDSLQYAEAMLLWEEALEVAKEHSMNNYALILQHNQASMLFELGGYEHAGNIAQRNKEAGIKNQDWQTIVYSNFLLGDIAVNAGDHRRTIALAKENIALADSIGFTTSIGYSYYQVASAFLEFGQLDSALTYATKGKNLSLAQNDLKEVADCNMALGGIYFALGQDDSAMSCLREVLAYPLYPELQAPVYTLMADIYARQNLHELAFATLRKANAINDSLEDQQTTGIILANFIEKLTSQSSELELYRYRAEVREQRNQDILLGLMIVAGLVLAFLWYRDFLQRQQKDRLMKLNNQLEKNNEALQKFAFLSSHDLLEPIRVIATTAGLLKRRIGEDPANQRSLGFIERSTNTLHLLTQGIRQYVEGFVQTPETKTWNQGSLEAWLGEFVSENFGQEAQCINIQPEAGLPDFQFPEKDLKTVLRNLVSNSLKYRGEAEPEIEIRVEKVNGAVQWAVSDNGIGIPEAYHDKVFEPFQALTNKTENNSAGIGLALCKLLVEKHGGRIWLESGEGSGTTMFFRVNAVKKKG